MTAILGISAYYHDSAAALVVDGEVVAAAQEERFTRRKHDASFPQHAVEFCLARAGLQASDLDYVCFYEKPWRKFERLLETYLAFAPAGWRSFCKAMPVWLSQKLHLARELRRQLRWQYRNRLVFVEHHESHAASAFYPSPFRDAAILTVDGVGEWATATMGHGVGQSLTLTHDQRFPHSLGMLYSAFTTFCGFRVNSGEYKLMGLAPYGRPRFRDTILSQLVDLKPDGSMRLDLSYFNYCHGQTMTGRKFERLFGGPPRQPDGPITEREMDLAASIQSVTEEALLGAARHVHQITGAKQLCMAGGVALNSVATGRLAREGPFERIWVQPASGDAGGALGAALFVWYQLLGNQREGYCPDSYFTPLLGPEYSASDICELLDEHDARYEVVSDESDLKQRVASLLADGNVVGWFQGRMEFGPRALGARSVLADPRDPNMQDRVNDRIKRRETFRPFAPAVPNERASDYFEFPPGCDIDASYMSFVVPVAKRQLRSETGDCVGQDKSCAARSTIPAVTHVDGSARVQVVQAGNHPRFHALLDAFFRLTNCPVLLNTSMNVRGEPIVCRPEDAYSFFLATDLDALVMESVLLLKADQRHCNPLSASLRSAVPQQNSVRKQLIAVWQRATFPIRWLVSYALLSAVFAFVVTPIGLILRVCGYDSMKRKWEKDVSSYWLKRGPSPPVERYFRQS